MEPKKKFVRSKLTSYCNFKKILVPLNVFLVFRAKLVNHSPDYIIRILARSKARENLRTKFSERLAPKLPRQAHTHTQRVVSRKTCAQRRSVFFALLSLSFRLNPLSLQLSSPAFSTKIFLAKSHTGRIKDSGHPHYTDTHTHTRDLAKRPAGTAKRDKKESRRVAQVSNRKRLLSRKERASERGGRA